MPSATFDLYGLTMPVSQPETLLVLAPHPDEETLGCGGTLLKHLAAGDEVIWVIVTAMTEALGFSPQRQQEIAAVAKDYGFSPEVQLGFAVAELDAIPRKDLVSACAQVIQQSQTQVLYVPFAGDAHSDHAMVFDALAACTKSFRYPAISQVWVYETLSETGYGMTTQAQAFHPNLWVDISDHLERKLSIMGRYASELAEHPFPRSLAAMRAQATLCGAQAHCQAAEAFRSVKSLWP